MKLSNILKKIGMNAIEQEIYTIALKYNEIGVGKISILLNKPRSSIYGYIGKMVTKQRLQETKHKNSTTYTATGPKLLILLLKKEEKEVGKLIYEISENEHLFEEPKLITNHSPKIRIHHGVKALELIVENTRFNSGYFIRDIDAMSRLLNWNLNQIYKEFTKDSQKGVKSIMLKSPMAIEYKKLITKTKKDYQIKFFPEKTMPIQSDTLLFEGKYIYIAYKEPVIAIEINNPLFYGNQRLFFETIRSSL